VSPQRSNRTQLIDGTLRCLERLPPERITARAIADESGANLASITYHFGSKDDLVTEAVVAGLDRWLAEIAAALAGTHDYFRAMEIVATTRRRHAGLARTFLAALARAPHDERVRETLATGFRRTRHAVAAVLSTGTDAAGTDAAGLALALFNGLLFQTLVDPRLAIEGDRFRAAEARLHEVATAG
jgi:AcrR family transcriptional regulator